MADQYVLKMNHISKRFGGTYALKDVSMKFEKGKVNVIMGENGAGKSTLMRILAGAITKDEGTIELDGKELNVTGPSDAIKAGISMIYQELNLVPYMSVAENVFVGRELGDKGFVNKRQQERVSNELLRNIGVEIDSSILIKDLTIAKQQMVEIAKSTLSDSKVLIMDEPTSSLTEPEVEQLFACIRGLVEKGVTIIYISHRMEEIFEIGDNITVLRDGTFVGQWPIEELDTKTVIEHMVGRTITEMFPKEEVELGDVVMEVKGLCKKGQFENLNFKLRKGEILGFSGLVGAGRTEMANVLFGKERPDSGEIILNGKSIAIKSPSDALDLHMGYVPEDRKQYGLNLAGSIKDNIAVTQWDSISKMGFVNKKEENELGAAMVEKLGIKIGSPNHPASSLSGGNQQKIVLAKWVSHDLDILILDEPTRGVDVGAKAEIHKIVVEFAKKGVGIILISSELPEVMGMSDRIIVMHEGRITGVVSREEATQPLIMSYAHGA
ncbi:MAG: sugar ABC transporter ATP-binding protein [Christensenella hongkongensis]|uniref:sugar ABC transporter ATP-binding protein n=1 Tax=Christensenella hongkongensis TaxID=270498 RepID=UPI002673266A|nr:sugar ABC transporter ATP-binding protein [Christensenella hongkongensis]MDY3005189.1 sugar ABC transporter ATP-binding protein [Christensenella hongkongensis]